MCLVFVQVNVLSACINTKFLQLSVNDPREILTLKEQKEMTSRMVDDSMATEAHLAPVTTQRKIRNDLEDSLSKACKLFILCFNKTYAYPIFYIKLQSKLLRKVDIFRGHRKWDLR